ncbi:MAG: AMP-binding protein [Spirochaetales bacterium]|nr:AMP-binding protein [Spirochaetales bacterium]
MKEFRFDTFSELYQTCISQLNPAGTALIYKEKKVTTNELIHIVKKYTQCFQEAGIKKGSRVGLSLADCPEILYAFIALSLLGACIVPMHHLLPASNKLSILHMSDAHFIISDINNLGGFRTELQKDGYSCFIITLDKNNESDYSINELIQEVNDGEYPAVTPCADDALLVLSSTGTSGQPKFVEITQRNVVNVVKATKFYMEPIKDFRNGYKILNAFPLAGLCLLVFISLIFLEITIIILDDFSPTRFLSLIEQWEVDVLAATPAYYEAIINLPLITDYKTDSVKRFYSGMDFLPNKRLLKIKECFKNTEIAGIGYGLTETSSVVMVFQAYNEEDYNVPTNCMTPVPEIDNEIEIMNTEGRIAEIGEQGEIIIRGPSVIKEYYKNPLETEKAFRKEGWFYTGDMGCKDEEGRIHILGRIKYIIKRGGRSISPVVIDNYLSKYQGVHTCAVVGVPHTMYGEMIWAFIIKGGDQNITVGNLMKYCRKGLPPYMIPDHISFIDRVPRKPGIGKIDSDELINIALKELKNISGGLNER